MDGTTEDRPAASGGGSDSSKKKKLDTIAQEVKTREESAPQPDRGSRPKLAEVARDRVRSVTTEVVA